MVKIYNILISLFTLILLIQCKSDVHDDSYDRVIYKPKTDKTFSKIASETPKTLTYTEYMNWIEENKTFLSTEKQLENLAFAVLYKPVDYCVLKDMDEQNYNAFKEKKKQYKDLQYFVFSIGLRKGEGDLLKSGLSNPELDFSQLVEYLAFKLQDDITLKDGNTILPCELFHFDRDFGLRPFCNFYVGFRSIKGSDTSSKTLIYKDKVFNSGIVRLTIPAERIKAIPSFENKNMEITPLELK